LVSSSFSMFIIVGVPAKTRGATSISSSFRVWTSHG
jgi:hypothetical protein